jgi:hypothetical protein
MNKLINTVILSALMCSCNLGSIEPEDPDGVMVGHCCSAFAAWGVKAVEIPPWHEDVAKVDVIVIINGDPASHCGVSAVGCTNLLIGANGLRSVINIARGYDNDNRVLVHEIGHALGIVEHSTDKTDIMYARANDDMQMPSSDQIAAMHAIYSDVTFLCTVIIK